MALKRQNTATALDTTDRPVHDDHEPAVTGLEPSSEPIDDSVRDGFLLDFVSGSDHLPDTPKEQVRQRIARALFHEYGICVEDMERDFSVTVGGKRRRVDLAVFKHDGSHTPENLRRVVICRPEPKLPKKGAVKMRDYDQAASDLEEIKPFLTDIEGCQYGLWTNGFEFFFLQKKSSRFQVDTEPIGDWPPGDETIGTKDVISHAHTRKADPEMLRIAFRRCHNFIHGNEGMPKDVAFWQFLYLIFCKMHDEKSPRNKRRFWAGPQEQFDPNGQRAIQKRILQLFNEVKREHKAIFRGSEEITLSPRALSFIVCELAKYEFTRTDVDAKGAAYQEIVGTNLRGDRGQYFTPRGPIKLVVEILDPKEEERILDPACGTGGFLVATLAYMMSKFRKQAKVQPETESTEEFQSLHERLRTFASSQVFGCDFDPFLIRATQMNMVMAGDGKGHLYYLNSLEFPDGYLAGLDLARKEIPLESMDVVITNPPFGSEIPITDQHILKHYDLAHTWERLQDGTYRNTGRLQGSVAPEILFIVRCLRWLKPGGRMGIVLPDGILGNPASEYIRWWILRHAWVLASIDLPVEVFIVEANVNILTSLVFLKKKPADVIKREDLGRRKDYPVFMAVAEKAGFDRRDNKIYKRSPAGDELLEDVESRETITVSGRKVTRTLKRKQKVLDDDLPVIAERYREFRQNHQEPGL
jgi:type I restriction enzyme M protein